MNYKASWKLISSGINISEGRESLKDDSRSDRLIT